MFKVATLNVSNPTKILLGTTGEGRRIVLCAVKSEGSLLPPLLMVVESVIELVLSVFVFDLWYFQFRQVC